MRFSFAGGADQGWRDSDTNAKSDKLARVSIDEETTG